MVRGSGSCNAVVQAVKDIKMTPEEKLVFNLYYSESRVDALAELSKISKTSNDLAPLIWNSVGTIAVLLQEIISVYPALSPPTLSPSASSRACNVVALLQSVASHSETRAPFLKEYYQTLFPGYVAVSHYLISFFDFAADIPHYLYPFLNTTSGAKSFEYLRATTLSVIGALAKEADTEIVDFLLEGQVIPLCLRVMETGRELSKFVASYIVKRIVLDDVGLRYICATLEHFFGLASVLESMVVALEKEPSARLLKNIVHCYLRLMDNNLARVALRATLPEALKNGTFGHLFIDEPAAIGYLKKLLENLAAPDGEAEAPHPGPGPAAGGAAHPGSGPTACGASRPGPGPAMGGSPGGSSQAGPSRVRR
ncbi:hypothetical protein U9M48_011682 [Paspalum notatum var. saurae]|uniref:Cell differentiation protein rcd1 n=1 Tax=Paspalum notatum var. saurae TaxID=547442 RepID=A0AAQ3SVY8_PASNO